MEFVRLDSNVFVHLHSARYHVSMYAFTVGCARKHLIFKSNWRLTQCVVLVVLVMSYLPFDFRVKCYSPLVFQ